jgi:hypothetical protein
MWCTFIYLFIHSKLFGRLVSGLWLLGKNARQVDPLNFYTKAIIKALELGALCMNVLTPVGPIICWIPTWAHVNDKPIAAMHAKIGKRGAMIGENRQLVTNEPAELE